MGHHIDKEGRFQSDKYPDLGPDKIVLSFKDREARLALSVFANVYKKNGKDPELVQDIRTRLASIELHEIHDALAPLRDTSPTIGDLLGIDPSERNHPMDSIRLDEIIGPDGSQPFKAGGE